MTSEGLGKMFEGDFADLCVYKFPLMLMGARREHQACLAEVEKGVEAGNKLPRKFLSLAESIGANYTLDVAFLTNLKTDLNLVLSVKMFIHLKLSLHIKFLSFCFLILCCISVRNICFFPQNYFCRSLFGRKRTDFLSVIY